MTDSLSGRERGDWAGADSEEAPGGVDPSRAAYAVIGPSPTSGWFGQVIDPAASPQVQEFDGPREAVIAWALQRTDDVRVAISGEPDLTLAEFTSRYGDS